MLDELCNFSATELLSNYRNKRLSPVDVARAVLDRITEYDDKVNAFCLVDEEAALSGARQSEARWLKGEPKGLVDGVPVSIKDMVRTKGWPTLMGSKAIDPNQAWEEDSSSVARLREHGAILLGKTCTPEFGHKVVTDSLLTGITRNPWNLEKSPGGSSGGAAAAVATGMGPFAIGSDGGGSIRIPSNWSGVFGLKPTLGRVPHYPKGWYTTLSHIGPITRTVEDAALMMTVITEPDYRDWYALPPGQHDYRVGLDDGVKGLKIAYSPNLGLGKTVRWPWGELNCEVNQEVAKLVSKAVAAFSDLGADVEQVDTLSVEEALSNYVTLFVVFSAIGARSIARKQRELLDPTFSRFVEIGEQIPLTAFVNAIVGREDLGFKMNLFHQKYDLLLAPSFQVPAPDVGGLPEELRGPPAFTCPFNLTGQPAASVPCGLTNAGLPVGLQIIGSVYRDDLVLRASRAYETARGDFPLPPIVAAK